MFVSKKFVSCRSFSLPLRCFSSRIVISDVNARDSVKDTSQPSAMHAKTLQVPELTEETIKKISAMRIKEREAVVDMYNMEDTLSPSYGKDEGDEHENKYLSLTNQFLRNRTATLFKKGIKAGQSGGAMAHTWHVQFNKLPQYTNPLMGWTSSFDALDSLQLKFDSLENAKHYLESIGVQYDVLNPGTSLQQAAKDTAGIDYSHKFFSRSLQELQAKKPKVFKKKAQALFRFDKARESTWVPPIKYNGDGVVEINEGKSRKSSKPKVKA